MVDLVILIVVLLLARSTAGVLDAVAARVEAAVSADRAIQRHRHRRDRRPADQPGRSGRVDAMTARKNKTGLPGGAEAGSGPVGGYIGDGGPVRSWAEFDAFYRSRRSSLLRRVRGILTRDGLGDTAVDAEGVVKETFEELWCQWERVKAPERWIYSVATKGRARQPVDNAVNE